MFHWKYFYWIMSFCDPQIEGIPKSWASFGTPFCCISVFAKNTRLKVLIQVSIRNVTPVKEYYVENSVVLCLSSQSLYSENFKKWYRYWCISSFKLICSPTIGSSSSIKMLIERPTLVEMDLIEKPLILVFFVKINLIQSFLKFIEKMIHLDYRKSVSA